MVSLFGANAGSPLFPLEVERRKDDGPTEGRWNGRTDRYPTRARFLSSDGFLLSSFSGAARIFVCFFFLSGLVVVGQSVRRRGRYAGA